MVCISDNKESYPDVGVIVGSVVGAVVLIMVILVACIIRRNNR